MQCIGDPDPPTVSIIDHSQNEAAIRTIEDGDTLTVTKDGVYDIQYLVSGASPAATVNITSGPWYRQVTINRLLVLSSEHITCLS